MKQIFAFALALVMSVGIASAAPTSFHSSSSSSSVSRSFTPSTTTSRSVSNDTYRGSTTSVQRNVDTRPAQPPAVQQARPMVQQHTTIINNNRTYRSNSYPYHGYPQNSNRYGSQYHGGWVHQPWTYSTPYRRVYYGNHWGFWLALAGIQTFIWEDQIGRCYYRDQYGVQQPWCDPAYPTECVCP